MLQITVNGPHDRPSVFEVDSQDRIEEFAIQDRFDILLDAHGRAVLAVTGQATGSHHAPQSFFLHEKSGLIGQGVSDAMVLMAWMDHDVGTVESWPIGNMVQERATRR